MLVENHICMLQLVDDLKLGKDRATQLNGAFAQFVTANPGLDELSTACEQYLEYAKLEAEPCGLEEACRDFLRYLRQLRTHSNAEEARIVRQEVQWYTAADADEMVSLLCAGAAVTSVVLKGAAVDAQDSDTISMEAASALAAGLAKCKTSLTTLALTDMKISNAGLQVVLQALARSAVLRRLDLSNLCSRWTVANTLGSERGAMLSELLPEWTNLECIILADCTLADGCTPVARAMQGLQALKMVDLSYNEMDATAALVLAKSLEGKVMLENVVLSGNELGKTGLAAMRALKCHLDA